MTEKFFGAFDIFARKLLPMALMLASENAVSDTVSVQAFPPKWMRQAGLAARARHLSSQRVIRNPIGILAVEPALYAVHQDTLYICGRQHEQVELASDLYAAAAIADPVQADRMYRTLANLHQLHTPLQVKTLWTLMGDIKS